MVSVLENKFPNDVQTTTELYTELQELLQNKSLGLRQISAIGLKQKPKPAHHHKKMKNEKSIVIKKSTVKSKIHHGKNSPV